MCRVDSMRLWDAYSVMVLGAMSGQRTPNHLDGRRQPPIRCNVFRDP